MSSETFDPSKVTVDDLFRAKKERRLRLAQLPFEQKIEIVKRLQTVVRTIRASRDVQSRQSKEKRYMMKGNKQNET